MTVHRCLHGETPRYLADLITPSAAATTRSAGLRSATSGSVAVPRTTSSLGDRSFAAAAPRAWNNLPSYHHFVEFIPLKLSDANSKQFSLLGSIVVLAHLLRLNLDMFD